VAAANLNMITLLIEDGNPPGSQTSGPERTTENGTSAPVAGIFRNHPPPSSSTRRGRQIEPAMFACHTATDVRHTRNSRPDTLRKAS
jgi:hypothetical protein